MHESHVRAAKPAIMMIDTEADLLADLAMSLEASAPRLAALLMEEVYRAEIVAPGALPDETARLGSTVEFLNESTGRAHHVRLVLPGEADIAEGAISVLTYAGAGLIGLSAGQSILWPDCNGAERTIRVTRVTAPS